VIALVRPLDLDSSSLWLHLPAAAASPVLLACLLAWRGGLTRLTGALLLGLYVVYVTAAVVVSV
jgi:Ca2+/Na+ antiporter